MVLDNSLDLSCTVGKMLATSSGQHNGRKKEQRVHLMQPKVRVRGAPGWAKDLKLQNPKPGPISVDDISWKEITEYSMYHDVAAIPAARLEDFLDGEEVRGSTCLLLKDCGVENQLTCCDIYVCFYGKLKGTRMRARAHGQAAWDAVVMSGSNDAVALGKSCKVGCNHHFQVKGYKDIPDVRFIKFTHNGDRSSMHHSKHEGRTDHVPHTDEVLSMVDNHLKARCGLRVIQSGVSTISSCRHICSRVSVLIDSDIFESVHSAPLNVTNRRALFAAVRFYVLEQLGMAMSTDTEEIAAAVQKSKHVRDYHITPDFIRHRREKVTDQSWKQHSQDAKSVKMAVRSICELLRLACPGMQGIQTNDLQLPAYVQYAKDQTLPHMDRSWLRCEIDDEGHRVVIVLAKPQMRQDAVKYGQGRALYMDATHGLQKYGLKLVTVLVKDHEGRGMAHCFTRVVPKAYIQAHSVSSSTSMHNSQFEFAPTAVTVRTNCSHSSHHLQVALFSGQLYDQRQRMFS
jgi:hypothetical protein